MWHELEVIKATSTTSKELSLHFQFDVASISSCRHMLWTFGCQNVGVCLIAIAYYGVSDWKYYRDKAIFEEDSFVDLLFTFYFQFRLRLLVAHKMIIPYRPSMYSANQSAAIAYYLR